MKKVGKRLLSWLMATTMVFSVFNISAPVKAEEQHITDSKVDVGTPKMKSKDDTTAVYEFDNTLNIQGSEIRSISVQFVSSATKGVEKIVYDGETDIDGDGVKDVELSDLTSGNWTHVMINSVKKDDKGKFAPISAELWKKLLLEHFEIYVENDNVRSIMVAVSEDVDFGSENLIEYNIFNGHYYELVQEQRTWTVAREESLKANHLGPAYEGYLVNVTSMDENAFLYTICRTTSWIGTTCDPNVKLDGSYDKATDKITYQSTPSEKYGYTLDSNAYHYWGAKGYWFYVDGPEAGKLMTFGPAQEDDHYDKTLKLVNTMTLAKDGKKYTVGSSEVEGAYEDDINNWANIDNWKASPLYEPGIGNDGANEPNNCDYDTYANATTMPERYMVIYSRNDKDKYTWMTPSMWNDFYEGNPYIGSYIIEYSPKPDEVADVTLDSKQSIVELNGAKDQTITGKNFGVIGGSDHLTVNDIIKEENGNVVVTVNGKPQTIDPEVSDEDIDKLNDAIDKNVSDVVTVIVTDKTTGQDIPILVTIIPVEKVALKSAETEPYRKEPGTEDKPGHYIAGEKVTLDNVTLNDGSVYSGDQLKNGNFKYQWQYKENETDTWKNIDKATGVTLSSKDTLKHAGDKVRLVITPSGDVKDLVANKDEKLYVDGDGYSVTDEDVTGTYIDNYVIDASDFIVKLDDAKTMKDADAITAAGADAEMNNKNGLAEDKPVTDSDVEKTLNKVSAPGDVDVTFKSEWLDYSAKDIDDNTKTGKTVTAHVVDNANDKIDDGKKYEIGVNDITVSTTTAKNFENADKDETHEKILVKKAGVVVVSDGETVDELKPEKVTIEYDTVKPLKAEIGDYDVTYIYEYSDGKTVSVKGKVSVVDPFFEIEPTNPDNPTDPTDGIEGPVEDTEKSTGNDYIYYIHLDNDVDTVDLNPDIVNADITKLEKDGHEVTVPQDGDTYKPYTVSDVPTDKTVEVKYSVKSKIGDKEDYTYTYIIDRAKSDDATIKGAEPGPGSTDARKIVEITTDKPEYTWPIELNDPKATVESIEKESGNGNLKYPDKATDPKDRFTVDNLKPGETTVVEVVTKAENGDKLTYEVRITNNKKNDNVNVDTETTDPTPDDKSDDPTIGKPSEPKKEDVDGDGNEDNVKDIVITVPYKVTELEVVPTREDPKSVFVTDFGDKGIKVIGDDTKVDAGKSSVDPYNAKFTVTDLKVGTDSVVAVKVMAEDGKTTCVYRYTIKRDNRKDPEDNVKIDTTADPDPAHPDDKPVVDDSKKPEGEGDEFVKKITITVPPTQEKVVVHPEPQEGKIDTTYNDGTGLKVEDKPTDADVTNNMSDPKPSFTVDKLSVDKDTVVSVKGVSDDGKTTIIYEYTIVRSKGDNVNVKTETPDPTPDDPSDDPEISDPEGPKTEDVDGDGKTEDVKDIVITVPYKVTSLEVVPTPEDPTAEFVTTFGNKGFVVEDGTSLDYKNSSLTPDKAKFTVKNLKVGTDSKVSVKVVSADGSKECVYRYTIKREASNDPEEGVKIDTTVDPIPDTLPDKPVVDDSKKPEKDDKHGDELVKKVIITVPSEQDKVDVHPTPEEGKLDLKYDGDGLKEESVPDGVTVDTSKLKDKEPTFTVTNLSPDEDTVVSVKGVSDDGDHTIIYEYTIQRAKGDNVNVITETPDPTPGDKSDDPEIGTPSDPKTEDVDQDGEDETVKDIKITVPNKVTSLEVVPTREDASSKFVTDFGNDGFVVGDGTTIDTEKSYVKDKEAKFTVNDLKVGEDSVVAVKVVSADGSKSCVYRYTIEREPAGDPDEGVKIDTTADPDPAHPEDKPVVDDSKDPEVVGNETVKKITITVPSKQEDVKVTPEPKEGTLDLKYNGKGLKVTDKAPGVTVTNNLKDEKPSFTVKNLSSDKDTIVSVKGVSDDGKNTVIYEYTIKRLSDDNVNVKTQTPDSTPEDPTDDPNVGEPEGPKAEDVDDDGVEEDVKDVLITVPNKVTSLEVVPTREDPSAEFVTDFGDSGIKVVDGTTIDPDNSSVNPKDAKFTVTDLKVSDPSVVLVKVKSADGTKECVYRYTIARDKNNDPTIKGVEPTPESTDDTKIVEITTDQPEYTWPIELNDPNATVESIEKAEGNGNVTYPEGEYPEGKNNFKVSDLKPGETTVVKVVTKAENGDTLTYLVKVTNTNDPNLKKDDPTAVGTPAGAVKPEDIVYEKTNPQDKTEPVDPSKKIALTGALKINGNPVDQYTVSPDGKTLVISKDYLKTLPKGTYPAVLTYSDGTVQNFNVSIVDFNEATIVKNPPLFSMYKEIVLKKKNTFTVNLKGISDYAVVSSKITGKGKKAKKIVSIKQQKNGDVLITPKKTGKTQVTCTIIQNGAEYKVVVDIKVLKQYKGTSKNYNLKTKGLVKTSGELPEFNVYKRIVKGKNTKIKFTKVAKDAKVKFYVANKKEAKALKIGKVKRKGKTATCTIVGKKKGWVHLTAEITQNGKTYYTRLLVRIDDGSWSKKQLNKYLK